MRIVALQAFLLLLAFAGTPSWADETRLLPDVLESGKNTKTQEAPAPLELRSDLFRDFQRRVEAAVASRDLAEVRVLYQTNGVAAEELKLELAHWRQILDEDAKASVSLWFKELGKLPPQAHAFWAEQARHLTTHPFTHLAFFHFGTGVHLTLPLVVVEDRLLIVPSDERKAEVGIEPSGPGNGSQPIRPETNGTPSAAGSRR